MAVKVFCDRCNRPITQEEKLFRGKLPFENKRIKNTHEHEDYFDITEKLTDLCQECIKSFLSWWKGVK